ncbi:hypothetical protein FJT64_026617 [Amphibalanus amphitrite]|uniref:Uncharacterized protein n=1 Tax=Amphibalanus amphitrite TaxID=1232801 RepID=A0A6A4VED8_AMPAM|nr:uncharacterized protein LOC122378137 [Amphibalanus amphitrite]KAF0291170.1 hypothetical protein FJT64_010666 [Amphibalanus amphitrite]KAF0291489.1 hypothetical protein FJT64_001089 [Amphibalanus amphitrite]KAF0301010.1 hypothetical protein FJT64_026617 [Amphibalanus amphitrite]
MRLPLLALLALLSVLSLAAWGAAWPRTSLATELRHRLDTRGSFMRLGRGDDGLGEPESVDEQRAESEPESADPLGDSESALDDAERREFARLTRPSFVRLGRMWLPRGSRASSIRLGRRSGDTNFPTSYKRYRIRLKRSV